MPGKVNRASPAFIRREGDASRALAQVSRNLNAVVGALRGASESGLRKVAERILARSQQLVPVETGALKASAFLDSETTKDGARAVVGYSENGSVPYAVLVHERPANHAPPTQWKFLQTAAQEVEAQIPTILAEHLKKETGIN